MSTPFLPIQIPPGVVSMATKKMRSSNWSEVNAIRWREGQLEPMGGQAQFTLKVAGTETYMFASRCKMIHGWHGLDGVYHIAYLCESNLYVDTGGTLFDITPRDGIAPPSGLVGGYGDGPYNDSTWGTPRTIPGSVAITKIPDAYSLDNFGSILYAMTSTDSRLLAWDPGKGTAGIVATLSATASFTTGSPNITMVANTVVQPGMSVFDLTNNKLIGTVLTYIGTALILTANAAFASSGAADSLRFGNIASVQVADSGRGPVPHARSFVVTPDRFIMVFGSTQDGTTENGSSRRVAWCDQENPGAWDYSNVASQAGFYDLEPASPIVCGISSRLGILLWTAKKVYGSKFLGLPYVYNFTELADGTTPWSPQSMVTTSSLSLWMSEQGVFSYDGTSILPIACMIRPWVDDDIDPILVREFSFAAHLMEFNEWWWFFPQLINNGKNTRAIVYNYKEGWWTQVRMTRSAGTTSSYTSHPIFADDGVAFQHEVGTVYVNADLPFAETFDLNLNSGGKLTTVKQMMPDIEGDFDNLLYSIFYRNSRSKGSPEMRSPPRTVRPDGYVDFRTTGRDVRLRIDVATPIVQPFTVGQHLIDAVLRGDR